MIKITVLNSGDTKAIYGGTRKINPQKNFETIVNINELQIGQEIDVLKLIKTLLKQFS